MAEPKPTLGLAMGAASKARAASRAAAYLGLAASSSVMTGWLLDIPSLRTILPGEAPMVALTALALALLSGALLLSAGPERRSVSSLVGRCLSAAAAALAVGGGSQYLASGGFRLDDWVQRLFSGPLQPGDGMALATACCTLGAAAGLLLQDARSQRLRRAGAAAALSAFVGAAVGALGYAYGLGGFHEGGPYSRMALVTAVTLGILSAGVLLSRPQRPWATIVLGGGEVTRRLLPAVVIAPLLLGSLQIYAARSGLLEAETGTALLVIVLAICLAALSVRLARDIERRTFSERRLRETLQGMNETLERRVAERTRDLEEAQSVLVQAQKMEAIGQLTGGVAHDFNNLLTIIRSSIDFLRRPDLSEERRRRYMDAVSDTVDRATRLTAQLLAFARRQALKPEVFDVGQRLVGMTTMLDTLTGARIRIVTKKPDGACLVRADVSQFDTALVNLTVNARDAMDGEGTLTFVLSCGRSKPAIRGHAASPDLFVALSVTDSGSGIDPNHVGRIFEPFFTTKAVGKGTGLGLSQVIGFAKQSGGDIDVASVVGHGTTFTLYLPEEAASARESASSDDSLQVPVGTGQRVMVVEDNIEVGKFATQILKDLGYRTEWLPNAEEALARLGADGNGFDAVFSDVVMPGMGGVALAEQLRMRLPYLPVVLASGYSHILADKAGHSFELLHKPYSADQLARVLGRLIQSPAREAHA